MNLSRISNVSFLPCFLCVHQSDVPIEILFQFIYCYCILWQDKIATNDDDDDDGITTTASSSSSSSITTTTTTTTSNTITTTASSRNSSVAVDAATSAKLKLGPRKTEQRFTRASYYRFITCMCSLLLLPVFSWT